MELCQNDTMELLIALFSLLLSVFFFYRWCQLWKAFEDLSIEYGRLWTECKQLRERSKNDNNKYW